jgi:hypothetical protein
MTPKYVDRLIAIFLLIIVAAAVLPAAATSLTAIAVIGTVCFIAIRAAVFYFTRYR